jgi:hypothetical protein
MRLRRGANLQKVATSVGDALRRRGIIAVLTGGACATLFSNGAYQSLDVDLVIVGSPRQADVDAALAELGFRREGDRFTHPELPFFVEFPRGPLAIGADHAIRPVHVSVGRARTLSLSATDSCRDRLAAFYYWDDVGALAAAVEIAIRQRVSLTKIRAWSESERMTEKYERFRAALQQRRVRPRGARKR